MARQEIQERLVFKQYGKVLYKRRWTIATFFVIVVTLITLSTLVQTPIYEATAVIQIEPAPPEVVSFKDVVTFGSQNFWANKEYYQTQFWIIRSEALAQEVVDKLDLTKTDAVFDGNPNAARQLSKMVRIQPLKNSQLVKVSVQHPNPDQAANICNVLAESYQEQNVDYDLKKKIGKKVIDWLKERSGENEKLLRDAEKDLLDFMKENGIVSFEGRKNIVIQQLTTLSDAHTAAKKMRIENQASWKKANSLNDIGKGDELPDVTDNNLIQALKEERILLEKQYTKLAEQYTDESPEMKKVKKQIDLLNVKISEEISNIVGSYKSAYLLALARENELGKAVEKAKGEAQDLNEKAIEYGVRKRKVDSASDIFDELTRRSKETHEMEQLRSTNIVVREQAVVPKKHIKPKRKTNVMLAAVLGLFGGIAIAFLLEYLDTTIKNQEDLERFTGISFLGIIPSFSSDDSEPDTELFTNVYPKSSITESIRSIRTNIIFSAHEKPLKSLLVTSAGPQEGKSTTVINLGIVFAQGGNRVLIVDSDLRRPRIHRAFNVTRSKGLTNLIMNEATVNEVIINSEVNGLSIIPCGPIPPNPSELLGSVRMEEVIKELEGLFDVILFDSPPIVAVTDAVVLSKKVDGVVLIIKSGKTTFEMLNKAQRQLGDVKADILGSVLNDFNIRDEGYRYYYYYRYYRSDDGDKEMKRVKKRKTKPPEETAQTKTEQKTTISSDKKDNEKNA